MSSEMIPPGIDALAGLELGGVPIDYADHAFHYRSGISLAGADGLPRSGPGSYLPGFGDDVRVRVRVRCALAAPNATHCRKMVW